MMGIQVGKYIGELLYEHDCVIVPGLGGFIANYQEATIDHTQGDILPPSKSISFNSDLQINDGLLINHITRRAHISYAEARNAVEEFAKNCKKTLESGEILALPAVGKLYQDVEGKLRFIPDSTNFLMDSFGLPKVQVFPILRAETPEEKIAIIESTVEKPIPIGPSSKRRAIAWFPIVATASVFLLFMLLIPLVRNLTGGSSPNTQAGIENPVKDRNAEKGLAGMIDTGVINDENAGLDVIEDNREENFHNDDNTENTLAENAEAAEESIADDINMDDTDDNPGNNLTEEVATPDDNEPDLVIEDSASPSPSGKEYIIVVGCFSVKSNAERLAEKIKNDGYTVDVGKWGKLNRVGVKVVGSRAMLKEIHQEVKDQYTSSAWILNR